MNLYAPYVGWLYFKYFIILFFALVSFYVGIDILTNLKDLPTSANLKLIYVGLISMGAVSYVLPLSLVLALILSKFSMIRNNELVSLYSLGITRNELIKPPFFIALAITLVYIGLNFTPFAYSQEFGRNLVKTSQISNTSSDIFVKFEGKFIYIGKLNPLSGEARDVRIFDINDSGLNSASFGTEAKFINGGWEIKDVNLTVLPQSIKLGGEGLQKSDFEKLKILENFKPKVIEHAAVGSSAVSILDALDFIFAFKDEGVGLNSAKTALYSLAITPFFAPLLVLIIYYFLPMTGRFMSLALTSFIFTIVSLCVWSVLFVLIRFAQNDIIIPEIAILIPIFLLLCFANYLYFRNR